MNRLPFWLKQEIPDNKTLKIAQLLSNLSVHTVCQEAKCPNLSHCFNNENVAFLILGDTCTRNCKFCNVKKSGAVLEPKQKSPPDGDTLRLALEPSLLNFDEDEPYRISQVVKILDLSYVVITSVSRDDLVDGGAGMFYETIKLIQRLNKDVVIEVLIPDFQGKVSSLEIVLDADPFVMAHNIETVRRLYNDLRPMADYELSLEVLRKIKEMKPQMLTKSSIMLGLGEKEEEVISTMRDLIDCNCDYFTLGQYLAPSVKHYPVQEFISPAQFQRYRQIGLSLGFKSVLSGPLVRSSYHAKEAHREFLYV